MRMRLCCLTLVGFFLCAVAFAQTPLAPAPGRRVVTVSAASAHGNEPSIAVNPNNTSQVVAAFQPATIAYSTDGAQTFTTAELPPVEGDRKSTRLNSSHPSISYAVFCLKKKKK